MFWHELAWKPLVNSIVLIILIIPPSCFLYVICHVWGNKIDINKTVALFYEGFGPGILWLFFVELLAVLITRVFISTMLGDSAVSWNEASLKEMYKFDLAKPVGVLTACTYSFVVAGFLEELTKLLFVTRTVSFVLYPGGFNAVPHVLLQEDIDLESSNQFQSDTVVSKQCIIAYFLAFR